MPMVIRYFGQDAPAAFSRSLLLTSLALLLIIQLGCNVSQGPSEVVEDNDPECERDSDCEVGKCVVGRCVEDDDLAGFLDPCEEDSDCESEVCIELATGLRCSESCITDADCDDNPGWECRIHQDVGGRVCQPAVYDEDAPTEANTLCGAAGVSDGDGVRLVHCLSPQDVPATTSTGDGYELQTGGFRFVAE